MSINDRQETAIDRPGPTKAETGHSRPPAWQPEGPTLRLKELLNVTQVSRSKAYELMKSDPEFPKGVPLYDGDRSPKFYWTHEAMAWVAERSNKFRSQRKDG